MGVPLQSDDPIITHLLKCRVRSIPSTRPWSAILEKGKAEPDRVLRPRCLSFSQHLPEHKIKALCTRVQAILLEESNVQPVQSPVTVCGDIHGQFWDVVELLRTGGMCPDTSYVFMGSSLLFLFPFCFRLVTDRNMLC